MKALLRTTILPTAAMLLYACIALPAYADTFPGSDGTVIERICSIDFDTFVEGAPAGMEKAIGATTGDVEVDNLIEQDTCVFVAGNSLRISGCDSTTYWHSLHIDLPDDIRLVTARFYIRGEDLQQEGNQFNNCYAGFWYDGLFGDRSNSLCSLARGTYGWTEVTVSLDLDAHLARDVKFTLFSSISGTLWIDDLTFLYDDECGEIEPRVVQGPLAAYINELYQPTVFMELTPAADGECPDSISGSEALQDIEMLKYLIENAYSGYSYWENQGIDFNAIYENLIELAEGSEKISVVEMERIVAEGLTDVQDGHLSIIGHERHHFLDRKNPYFADVIVERMQTENGDIDPGVEYTVVCSNCDSVEPGMTYVGAEDQLFRILSRYGIEQYQLGVFTSQDPIEASFQFQAKSAAADESGSDFSASSLFDTASVVSITLPLHESRLTKVEHQDDRVYYTTEVEGIDFIRISSFSTSYHESLQEFVASGATLAEQDRVIVDLMGNHGGRSVYAKEFVMGLNSVAQWRMYSAVFCTPATIGSGAALPITEDMPEGYAERINQMRQALERLRDRPVRNWMYVWDELTPRQMGDYEGRAVFLIDRGVASSGEALIDYSKSIPGAVLIGENSAGVGTFGEVYQYWLPNSLICLLLPCKLFLAPGIEEGIGYIPDYWLDSAEPVMEIARWLNNPDSYQFELSKASPLTPDHQSSD